MQVRRHPLRPSAFHCMDARPSQAECSVATALIDDHDAHRRITEPAVASHHSIARPGRHEEARR